MTFTDSEADIRKLFDEHFHHLLLSSLHYVHDYHQAEDIVQDVFVKVWQNFAQLSQMEDLKGYLFKAVKNSSLNYLRSLKVRQKFTEESAHTNQAYSKSAEELSIEDETQGRILRALSKLPELWQEAFVLSNYKQLKYHEIAREMKISQKTVEKYISKALQLLREELKDLVLLGILLFYFFS